MAYPSSTIAIITLFVVLMLWRSAKNRQRVSQAWSPELRTKMRAGKASQDRVRANNPVLFETISKILFTHDPMETNFESNTDEYDPQAATIIPRLASCASEEDVLTVVHEEFCRWFGAQTAGPTTHYEEVAKEIWNVRSAGPTFSY